MPKLGQIVKISIIIIVSVFVIIYGSYILFKLDSDHLAALITTGVTSTIGLFIAVFQIKSKKDSEDTKEEMKGFRTDITTLKTDVKNTKKELDKIVITITEKDLRDAENKVWQINAITDIRETLEHKKDIDNLGKKIDVQIFTILEKSNNVCNYIKDLITQMTSGIGEVLIQQYNYGFDEFDISHLERKLNNKVNMVSEHIDFIEVNKDIIDKVFQDVKNNIEKYIEELNFIKELDNGKRRKRFKKLTINMTNKIATDTIDTYKLKKMTA